MEFTSVIFLVVCVCICCADDIYTATFYNPNGTMIGKVEFNQGNVKLDLESYDGIDLSCFESSGYAWHLHDHWYHPNGTSHGWKDECEEAGDHWDPTYACSLASANPACDCLNKTDFYNCQYGTDPYSCEVGDFSSKYDAFVGVNENEMGIGTFSYEDPYLPTDLAGRSIVFHCTDYSRIFCGELIHHVTDETTDPPSKPVSDIPVLTANFGFGSISLTDFEVDVSAFDAEVLDELASSLPGGSECYADGLKWHIHTDWTHDTVAAAGVCGSAETGGHYDPTAACGSASGNEECDMCGLDTAEYACDYEGEVFSCEVGDFSSKFGMITVGMPDTFPANDLPPLHNLLGQSIVLHCGNTGERAACAQLLEGGDALTTVVYTTPLGQQTIVAGDTVAPCLGDACPERPNNTASTMSIAVSFLSIILLGAALL